MNNGKAERSARNKSLDIGAGIGMIVGAAFGDAGVGLVLGAAVGLVGMFVFDDK